MARSQRDREPDSWPPKSLWRLPQGLLITSVALSLRCQTVLDSPWSGETGSVRHDSPRRWPCQRAPSDSLRHVRWTEGTSRSGGDQPGYLTSRTAPAPEKTQMAEETANFSEPRTEADVAGAALSRFRRFLAHRGLMFTQLIATAITFVPHRHPGGCEFRRLSGCW
jgi:hypothetical protein